MNDFLVWQQWQISQNDWQAILLTLKVASITTIILMLVGTPLAWWLSQTKSRLKTIINVFVALPLILPPTVIGFYMLLLMSPTGWLGQLTQWLGIGDLAFTFSGLVLASVLYSLPFVIQPLQNAFTAMGKQPLEMAAMLGAHPLDCFFSVVIPLTKPAFYTAAILVFAHTVGEFGVILMVGGNIPEETKVVAIQIYEHVESLQYQQAHSLSALMMLFAVVVLTAVYTLNRPNRPTKNVDK